MHEVDGTLFLGPPKTRDSVRPIALPPFLVQLLRELLDSHDHDVVFCGARGGFQRRSYVNRRARQPAVTADPVVVAGLHFHDLRHSHKTWLIEGGIPRSRRPAGSGTAYPACEAST